MSQREIEVEYPDDYPIGYLFRAEYKDWYNDTLMSLYSDYADEGGQDT